MATLEIQIKTDKDAQELLGPILMYNGFEGVWLDKGILKAYISAEDFDEDRLKTLLQELGLPTAYTYAELEAKNWNADWESQFQPVLVDDQVQIRAPHHKAQQLPYDVLISPQMSFGTGHHDTTVLMARQQLFLGAGFKRVLDFGSGTGILAILGEKIGYQRIDAIDIDPNSVRNMADNIALNGSQNISVLEGDIDQVPNTQYQLILANVTRNVILERLKAFTSMLDRKGYLVISGFFVQDVEDMVGVAQKHGMNFIRTLQSNNWASVILVKI